MKKILLNLIINRSYDNFFYLAGILRELMGRQIFYFC